MKKKLLYILVPFLTLVGGCKKYLDVNKNVDAPDQVEGYLYLANIIQQFQGIYWDNRAVAPMIQMMGTSNTYFSEFAKHYYYPARDEGGEMWRVTYWNHGMNLENMINQSMAAENWTLAGIGYAIKAFSWDATTKLHGELPMKDAFVPDLLTHNYDYQDEIYEQIRAWARLSIELLEREDKSGYGNNIVNNDFMYAGDKEKWKKFAYAVIVRNLSSLSNKTDFKEKYAQELIEAAAKSFQNPSDDATIKIAGGSQQAPYSGYNNFYGTARGNLSNAYWQHDYAVQIMTGTVPQYDPATGNKISITGKNPYYPYELAVDQVITDTLLKVQGHFDPRVTVKLGTTSNPNYLNLNNADSVKTYKYYGASFTTAAGPIATASNFYGRTVNATFTGTVHDGTGRWIYRDDAPYILTTYAEIQFCLAETYFKLGRQTEALAAFKKAVAADMETAARYISVGKEGSPTGGDKITKDLFTKLANEYVNGPYVNGLSQLTLSHIMMQKWVALFPWGAQEAWVDMRKYHYDIQYTGEYPKNGNGWVEAELDQKMDTNPSKVYKGFYLAPAQVQSRKGRYDIRNEGSPSYRLRPRYNSEYMWNLPSLGKLKPIPGTADNYQTSIPWFAYPGDMPK